MDKNRLKQLLTQGVSAAEIYGEILGSMQYSVPDMTADMYSLVRDFSKQYIVFSRNLLSAYEELMVATNMVTSVDTHSSEEEATIRRLLGLIIQIEKATRDITISTNNLISALNINMANLKRY